MTLAIKQSVGKGGVNAPPDVKIVQQLLNAYLASIKAKPLAVDGQLTAVMVIAIADFQVKIMHQAVGDGRVEPAGNTFKALVQAFGAQVAAAAPAPAPLAKPNQTATAAGLSAAATLRKG